MKKTKKVQSTEYRVQGSTQRFSLRAFFVFGTLYSKLRTSFLVLCTLYSVFCTSSYAQVFPVQANTTIRGPYSLNLTDYASPAYDRIQTNLYLSDLSKVHYPVKIRLVIKGPGGINISTSPGNEMGPVYLDGGINHPLTGAELYSLFDAQKLNFSGISYNQYKANQALPEGIYQFQFEVLDYNLGVVISNVNSGFATAWLVLNDPPIINKPAQGVTIVPVQPQNIFFQWTPRHTGSPNSAFTTQYNIQMVEIYPAGRNANDAMLTSPLIFEATTSATAYNYGIIDPQLVPGKWYAFRVRAQDVNNLDLFKNQGYSEVYSFYYGQPCPLPQHIKVAQADATSALVSWDYDEGLNSVTVEYKSAADKNWKTKEVFTGSTIITGLAPATTYTFRTKGNCSNNASSYSDEQTLTTAGGQPSCKAPQYYKAERTQLLAPNQKVNITWLPVQGVASYSVLLQSAGLTKTYTKKANDDIKNSSGQDLFGIGTVPDTYFSIEDQIPNAPFTLTFTVTCSDGSTVTGKTETVDLDKAPLSGSTCALPAVEKATAVAKSQTSVNVTWTTESWFKSYVLRYRILGSNAAFTEIRSSAAAAVIPNPSLNSVYEYQIVYTCLNGTTVTGGFNTFLITLDPSVFSTPGSGDCFPPVKFSYEIKNGSATISWEKDKETDYYYLLWKKETDTGWDSLKVNGTEGVIANLAATTSYVYKIKPICKSGLAGIASTTGKFQSSPATQKGANCPPPNLNPAEATSDKEIVVQAEANALYTNYLIEIRVYDSKNQWMEMNVATAKKTIAGLQPNTLYEYHIAGFCGTDQSDFSITDTIRTAAVEKPFVCGVNSGYTIIGSRTPITSLAEGDEFSAADFTLKVKELTSNQPYNGTATASVPYLKNSSFNFQMLNVMVNDQGQMYAGQINMQGMTIALIDPKLADKISSFVDKMDAGLEKADMYITMADSIQTALNDVIATANEPVDWEKYKDFTPQQLFEEGKRLVKEGQKLIANGTPQSVAEAKKMLIEGIKLIKAAAAMAKQGGDAVAALKDELDKLIARLIHGKIEDDSTTLAGLTVTLDSNATIVGQQSATIFANQVPSTSDKQELIENGFSFDSDTINNRDDLPADLLQELKQQPGYKEYIQSIEDYVEHIDDAIYHETRVDHLKRLLSSQQFGQVKDFIKDFIRGSNQQMLTDILNGTVQSSYEDIIRDLIERYLNEGMIR